jgi:hypothetical protein
MWTFESDVTGDAAAMTGGQDYFVGMLLDFLCRNIVSILTNNIALLYVSYAEGHILMRKNLQLHFSSEHPKSKACGISTNTNLPTIMTRRDKLTMSLCTCIFGFWLHTIIQARIFRIIQTNSVYYHKLNNIRIKFKFRRM